MPIPITPRFALTLLLSLTAACESDRPASAEPAAKGQPVESQVSATAHAPALAEPGSHEDWCDEHQVPESQCTRCNTSLVAAFKATGDWCVEHGVPESQCRLCNPDLKIERPPKKAPAQ